MDLSPVAYCSAVKGKLPFVNFFDGFRTSHEIQKIETWDYEDLKDLIDLDAVQAFRDNALNPTHPCQMGSAQNPDLFFQTRESCNPYYDAMPAIVEEYMNKVNAKLGTDYKLFNYYGAPDAEQIIIAMGSVNETIEETVDYLNARGRKVGVVKVRLYRPFWTGPKSPAPSASLLSWMSSRLSRAPSSTLSKFTADVTALVPRIQLPRRSLLSLTTLRRRDSPSASSMT